MWYPGGNLGAHFVQVWGFSLNQAYISGFLLFGPPRTLECWEWGPSGTLLKEQGSYNLVQNRRHREPVLRPSCIGPREGPYPNYHSILLGPIVYPKTLVRNYHYSLRNNPEECSSLLDSSHQLEGSILSDLGANLLIITLGHPIIESGGGTNGYLRYWYHYFSFSTKSVKIVSIYLPCQHICWINFHYILCWLDVPKICRGHQKHEVLHAFLRDPPNIYPTEKWIRHTL